MRLRFAAGALVLGSSLTWDAFAGSATAVSPDPQTPVIGVSTEIVRVDAVVTDQQGHYVTDLGASDFELREDGRPQAITNFEYVVTGGSPSSAPPPTAPTFGSPLAPRNARRTIAIVVDDLSLPFEDLVRARKMLVDLVDRQLGPGDVAAIIRTGGGIGSLQQFTSDRLLLASVRIGTVSIGSPSRKRRRDAERLAWRWFLSMRAL